MTQFERLFDTVGMRSAEAKKPALELVRGAVTTAATLAHERTLPVVDQLEPLVPTGGLQRGSTVAVHGVGGTSFALALVGQAVREGSFLAVVAPASFGLAACIDFDIPLRRVVQFVLPDDLANWAQAVAAIIEGFDLVLLADQRKVRPAQARQLSARNRERGSVVVRIGGPSWPDAADVRFDVTSPRWFGLGQGHGHLQERQVQVQVAGRRYHQRQRVHHLRLPSLDHQQNERFAGADIDAMLDAVDAASSSDEHEAGFDATA